jgi:hypothetical protein
MVLVLTVARTAGRSRKLLLDRRGVRRGRIGWDVAIVVATLLTRTSMACAAKVLLDLGINDDVGWRVATSARHTELLESAKSQHQKSSTTYVEALKVVRLRRLTLLLPILLAHATALALDLSLHGREGGSELLEVVEGADPASLDLRLSEDDSLVCVVT